MQLRLEDAISFRPQIDSTWTGGDICIITAAVLRIEATFTIGTGAGNFVCNSGNGQVQVVSGGRLHKTSGGTSTVSTLLDNDGTVAGLQRRPLARRRRRRQRRRRLPRRAPSSPSPASARVNRPHRRRRARPHDRERRPLPGGATLDPAALTLDSGTLTLDGARPPTTLPLVTLSGGTFTGARNRTYRHAERHVRDAHRRPHRDDHRHVHQDHRAASCGSRTASASARRSTPTWTGGDICIITGAVLRIERDVHDRHRRRQLRLQQRQRPDPGRRRRPAAEEPGRHHASIATRTVNAGASHGRRRPDARLLRAA